MAEDLSFIRMSGNKSINDIITFHDSPDPNIFYQKSLVPFNAILMYVPEENKEKSVVYLVAPDSEFAVPVSLLNWMPGESQHQHNVFEFTYILSGSMYQVVEGKRFFYPTGSCCLMNRNTLHTEELSTGFTCIFLSISPQLVARLMKHKNDMLFSDEGGGFNNLIFDFFSHNLGESETDEKDFLDFTPKITQKQQVQMVHQIFEELLFCIMAPKCGATYRVLSLMMEFINILCNEEYYNGVHVTAKSNMDSLLFSRIDQILSERHGRITHSELAELLNYNGSYLGRIVKKFTGKSLFDYSMTFAMAYAAELLTQTDMSTSEIVSQLQFTNRSHFYKIFKEAYGLTPKEYRAENKK